jgi:hypothetical protein
VGGSRPLNVQILGDAWLARIFDNEEEFQRLDFGLAEVSSSADWVRKAAEQSAARARGECSMASFQQLQSSVIRSHLTPADGKKVAPEHLPRPEDAARVLFFCAYLQLTSTYPSVIVLP